MPAPEPDHGARFSPEPLHLLDEKSHAAKHFPLGDLIWLDRERCIQCARCIRFQDEIAGEPVLAFYQRARATDIITNSEPGFDSVFSGNTTDICPVGALTTADFRFGARPWEMKAAASVCAQCPVGCNITFNTRREAKSDGKVAIKRVMPRQNEAVNEIWMCDKGRFAYHYTESDKRLGQPLVRANGKLEPASWENAFAEIAQKVAGKKEQVVVLAGGRLSNEDLFNLKQLADHLGGEVLLYTHMGGGELTTSFGVSAGTNFSEMGPGTTILVVASDLYNEAPVWYLRVKQAAKRGATLIVANARETKLERYSKFVVRYSYGDEVETVKGLAGKTKIGQVIGGAENLVILYGSDGLGLEGSSALANACADLVKGRAGKPNNGLIGVWPHANDQGAWELGFQPASDLANRLAGKNCLRCGGRPGRRRSRTGRGAQGCQIRDRAGTLPDRNRQTGRRCPPGSGLHRTGWLIHLRRTPRSTLLSRPSRRGPRRVRILRLRPRLPPDSVLILKAAPHRTSWTSWPLRSRLFSGVSYLKLAEVTEQWPIVGRRDLYYGGTTYENKQGLGVQLALNPGSSSDASEVKSGTPARMKTNGWRCR